MSTSLVRAPPWAWLLYFRPSSAPTQWVCSLNRCQNQSGGGPSSKSQLNPCTLLLHLPLRLDLAKIIRRRPSPVSPCWSLQSTSDALPPRGIARPLASQISPSARYVLRSTITPSPARSMCSRLLWSCCIWGRYGVGGCIHIGELGRFERSNGLYQR
jgi:hypothetical protein